MLHNNIKKERCKKQYIIFIKKKVNALNVQLNPICLLLALFAAHHILHFSGLRVIPVQSFQPTLIEHNQLVSISLQLLLELAFLIILMCRELWKQLRAKQKSFACDNCYTFQIASVIIQEFITMSR
jgi:hypothetical protein